MQTRTTLARTLILLAVLSHPCGAASITAIWANDGLDKVTQEELRGTRNAAGVTNTVWDGTRILLFGSRNEVVSCNVILEASQATASGVAVSLKRLTGPGEAALTSFAATGDGVFDWTQRPIELFYVRYLQIRGLSKVSYSTYDERHVPKRFRRPWSGDGMGRGAWVDRPDHNKFYPEIAVPLELVPTFTIAKGQNQSIWVDVYIPKNATPGVYQGNLTIEENRVQIKSIPVELRVVPLTLPDTPSAKTMLYFSPSNIDKRYGSSGDRSRLLRDRHFLMAHRHKIALIGDDAGNCGNPGDQPCPEWVPRLDGRLFTAANGYDGPGVGVGNGVYSIGTYGTWGWKSGGQAAMNQHTDAWARWFNQNSPQTEYFLYLADESSDTKQMETWASWILKNPGPGQQVKSLATIDLPTAASKIPSLDLPTSTLATGVAQQWQPAADRYTSNSRKRLNVYNGHRPGSGSFATEDDGVALRQLAWVQYKKHIHRWFFWESTYYNNYQGGTGQVNVFRTAETFGGPAKADTMLGENGWNYSNGDGVLFYPGTDVVYPADSYGVNGPFASLRLKAWRRGIQDVDYLTMAAAAGPGNVQTLVQTMVPKALWDYGVSDANDPSWVRSDVSWNSSADAWENARAKTITIISGINPLAPTFELTPGSLNSVRVFPNPWRKDKHAGSPVTFDNIPANSSVKIFTLSAYLVKTLTTTAAGSAVWDLKTDSGANAASGLYLYLVETPDKQTARGKFALIR